MKNRKMLKLLAVIMAVILTAGIYSGCGSSEVSAAAGTLILKVNPEFEISYDEKGNVVSVMPMNDDAAEIMDEITDYQGKPSNEVVTELVKIMEKEGYIDSSEGKGKNINIEVKTGSVMPDDAFLDIIVTDVKTVFDDKQVMGKIVVSGESNYGISEYEVSDYGNSDYKAARTKIDKAVEGGSSYTDYSNTDYDGYNSDYDTKTDYDGKNTDYNSNYDDDDDDNDSNYSSSSSKPQKKPSDSSSGKSDYDSNSNYSNSNYNSSSYDNDDDDDDDDEDDDD